MTSLAELRAKLERPHNEAEAARLRERIAERRAHNRHRRDLWRARRDRGVADGPEA